MNEAKLQKWVEMREIALAVLDTRGDDPEVCRQVEALIGGLDDTLSDEFILEELRGLQAGGPTFRKVLADNSPKLKHAEERWRYKLKVVRFTKRRIDPNSSDNLTN